MDRALELGINFFETADVMAVNSALELWRSFWVVGLPKVAEGVTQ
jgi:aryl-alcohol dehydrogenase-like predicted oxidoreductase